MLAWVARNEGRCRPVYRGIVDGFLGRYRWRGFNWQSVSVRTDSQSYSLCSFGCCRVLPSWVGRNPAVGSEELDGTVIHTFHGCLLDSPSSTSSVTGRPTRAPPSGSTPKAELLSCLGLQNCHLFQKVEQFTSGEPSTFVLRTLLR
jgi:hypothetical protein